MFVEPAKTEALLPDRMYINTIFVDEMSREIEAYSAVAAVKDLVLQLL